MVSRGGKAVVATALLALALLSLCTLGDAGPGLSSAVRRMQRLQQRVQGQQPHQRLQAGAAAGSVPDSCRLHWYNQTIDHFSYAQPSGGEWTYQQRFYVCAQHHWSRSANGEAGPIFFYAGNEGDVTMYVNHTGLMWENAPQFGALLVFAEHRYYGLSQPFGSAALKHMQYLTHEQAMADYAELLFALKADYQAEDAPVIVFGGSYGGMLSAWLRAKYPTTFHGAISSSAPVLPFPGMTRPFNTQPYWKVVTDDATAAGGSVPECADNVRASWPLIFSYGTTQDGRDKLAQIFRMCKPLQTEDDVDQLAVYLKFAWDNMAMGNYPYPSNYMTGGGPLLPAFPVRQACQSMKGQLSGDNLLYALSAATTVFNNATQNLPCYTLPDDVMEDGIWDYQFCTQLLPQESYFETDGVNDMFWPQAFNWTFINERCQATWGVVPRPNWISISYGPGSFDGVTNIVFSSGSYDPWSFGGETQDTLAPGLKAVWIDQGAHHLDLFFSNAEDPQSVKDARAVHVASIRSWIAEHYAKIRAKSKAKTN